MKALGRHILVEFIGCSSEILNDVSIIEKEMVQGAQESGATVINSTFHHFSPYGVSGVVVIQESHLAIHTWPEFGYAAVDLFTCGDTVDPWISFDYLKQKFKAQQHSAIEMYRGSLNLLNRSDFIPPELSQEQKVPQLGPKYTRSLWFTDRDENQALSLKYSGDLLFEKASEMQKVRVFETTAYGKMLSIDSCVMITERDEAHYHEMLVHPAMQIHPMPKNILVIGGGDGGTIREIFKYPTVEKVTMVEIDKNVVDAAKEFFPKVASEFSNPKLNLIIGDGIAFVAEGTSAEYDVIVIDGADPKGPAEGLFSEEFYLQCQRLLKENGIVAAQGESPMFHEKAFKDLNSCLKKIFGMKKAHVALFFAPTYPSGMWSIHIGTKQGIHPVSDFNVQRAREFSEKNQLHYYNEEVHRSAFALPSFVSKLLSEK